MFCLLFAAAIVAETPEAQRKQPEHAVASPTNSSVATTKGEHEPPVLNPIGITQTPLDTNLMQVTFVLPKSQFFVGEPVECEYQIRNTSSTERYYCMGGQLMEFSVAVELLTAPPGARGRHADAILVPVMGPVPVIRLRPGEFDTGHFSLNYKVWFTEAGAYKIRLRYQLVHGERANGKIHWASDYVMQTLSLECIKDPKKLRALLQALVYRICHGDGDDAFWARETLCDIGLRETVPYLKECLLSSPSNDFVQTLFTMEVAEVPGVWTEGVIEDFIQKKKNSDDPNVQKVVRRAEDVLKQMKEMRAQKQVMDESILRIKP